MALTVSKTKKDLIDVARQLFAKKGVENTTMNDIAEASQRGRRTLYTYFRSKQDIYKAVIESELSGLYSRLEEVIKRDIVADEKLLMLAFTRLNAIKDVVTRNGTSAPIFRDIWQVENVRKEFDKKDFLPRIHPERWPRQRVFRWQMPAKRPKYCITPSKA